VPYGKVTTDSDQFLRVAECSVRTWKNIVCPIYLFDNSFNVIYQMCKLLTVL